MGWTVDGIAKQIKRLRAIPRNNDDRPWDVVAPEFARVLQQIADDDKHAERIVDHLIDTVKFCPAPIELRDTGLEVSRQARLKPTPDCPKCNGTGHEIIERAGMSGARRCDCWTRSAA